MSFTGVFMFFYAFFKSSDLKILKNKCPALCNYETKWPGSPSLHLHAVRVLLENITFRWHRSSQHGISWMLFWQWDKDRADKHVAGLWQHPCPLGRHQCLIHTSASGLLPSAPCRLRHVLARLVIYGLCSDVCGPFVLYLYLLCDQYMEE